jgi:hypothetical protein
MKFKLPDYLDNLQGCNIRLENIKLNDKNEVEFDLIAEKDGEIVYPKQMSDKERFLSIIDGLRHTTDAKAYMKLIKSLHPETLHTFFINETYREYGLPRGDGFDRLLLADEIEVSALMRAVKECAKIVSEDDKSSNGVGSLNKLTLMLMDDLNIPFDERDMPFMCKYRKGNEERHIAYDFIDTYGLRDRQVNRLYLRVADNSGTVKDMFIIPETDKDVELLRKGVGIKHFLHNQFEKSMDEYRENQKMPEPIPDKKRKEKGQER